MSHIGRSPKWNRGRFTPQSSDPSNPQEGDVFYSDGTPRAEGLWKYKDSEWVQVASIPSTINYISDPNAEGPLVSGQWNAYADAASDKPVDGTGGSPTVTVTRITSGQLRGTGSFRLTKDAANRQGEGVSTDFVIDEHDKNKVLTVKFDYDSSANFATDDISAWIYDKDNSQLISIAPDEKLKVGSNTFQGTFLSSDADDYRLIIHVASTNASSYTMDFDNVSVGPQELVYGPAMSDAYDYTPTGAWTTNTTYDGKWWRVGDTFNTRIVVNLSGAPNAATLTIDMPFGLVIDTDKLPSSVGGNARVGHSHVLDSGVYHGWVGDVFVGTTTSLNVRYSNSPANNQLINISNTAPVTFTTNDKVIIDFSVPIEGWSTNVVTSESRIKHISQSVSNGSRVTTDPAALGEYRTLIKDNAAQTFSDDAPSQTAASIASDGMRIYTANGTGAGTSGQPWRWDIYVGENKNVQFRFFSGAGKTGRIDADYYYLSGSNTERGLSKIYDPVTGIVSVYAPTIAGSSNRTVGNVFSGATAAVNTGAQDCYFDVIVSDQTIAVQHETSRDKVVLDTGNGHGATNTKFRNFTNTTTVGTSLTATLDGTDGAKVVVNKSGNYSVAFTDIHTAAIKLGVSINSSEGTTNIDALTTDSDRVSLEGAGANEAATATAPIIFLEAGDVIRAHTDGVATDTSDKVRLIVSRVN